MAEVMDVPQSEPLNERMAINNAGGFSFVVNDETKLRRFLILGAEGGSYYVQEKQLKLESAATIMKMIKDGQGVHVVNELKAISVAGRAPKQAPGIFALALCARFGDDATKKAAFNVLADVCRTGSTLFDFVTQWKALGKDAAALKGVENPKEKANWGRSIRHGIQRWYMDKDPSDLAYQLTKYVQRGGWSHRDLLRLVHPNPTKYIAKRKLPTDAPLSEPKKPKAEGTSTDATEDVPEDAVPTVVGSGQREPDAIADDLQLLFHFVVKNVPPELPEGSSEHPSKVGQYIIDAFKLKNKLKLSEPPKKAEGEEKAEGEADKDKDKEPELNKSGLVFANGSPDALVLQQACDLVKKNRFSHEHVGDSRILKCPCFWTTLLEVGMPMTAMIRSLARMTAIGALEDARHREPIISKLTSQKALQAARIHPITLLEAMKVYKQGCGEKGSLTWMPHDDIVAALDKAFYMAFKTVVPTGKRILLGVDVSGSMEGCMCQGMKLLSSREAAAAMAMTFVRTETNVTSMAFCDKFVPLTLAKEMSLDDVIQHMRGLPFGGTDCSLPMKYAAEHELQVDTFIVLTDNETWAGGSHPVQELQKYRTKMGIPAQLVVLGFAVNDFSIADPNDAGMLDVAGLDSAVPQIVADFMTQKV